jgi:cytochrome c oxidase cbb3-type subunit 3
MCSPCRRWARGIVLAAITLAACERERRPFHGLPVSNKPPVRELQLEPGSPTTHVVTENPAENNAYSVSEGKTLYNGFNCSGCHFQGGGGIGPPLMDDEWVYGSPPPPRAAPERCLVRKK